jgi:nucleoside-diphosphate-sugar epimerase
MGSARKILVLGCGYVGQRLVPRLLEAGHPVVATTSDRQVAEALQRIGAETTAYRLGSGTPPSAKMFLDVSAIVHLAPPADQATVAEEVTPLLRACSDSLRAYVYGSSTGAFGSPPSPGTWVDETSPPWPADLRGQRRREYEEGLRDLGVPVRVVRIAGIYGPGRTLARRLREGRFFSIDDGPTVTSRIHVDDLVRIMQAMLAPDVPDRVVAADEVPFSTARVAEFTAELLGLPSPSGVSMDEARDRLHPLAFAMRTAGRRCRSLYRHDLIGDLRYPSFLEGVPASLREEGCVIDDSVLERWARLLATASLG